MILQELSRTELINRLQGMSRKQLKEELLNLHAKLTTKAAPLPDAVAETVFYVPLSTARGMVALSDATSQRKLRKKDPSLFDREANGLEIEAAEAAIWDQYHKIDIQAPQGVEKRRAFRKTFAKVFNQ